MNDQPYHPLPTFIREQWTRAVTKEIHRFKHMDWMMNFGISLLENCILAFIILPMLFEKYLAAVAGYEALGRRFYHWLKLMKGKQ